MCKSCGLRGYMNSTNTCTSSHPRTFSTSLNKLSLDQLKTLSATSPFAQAPRAQRAKPRERLAPFEMHWRLSHGGVGQRLEERPQPAVDLGMHALVVDGRHVELDVASALLLLEELVGGQHGFVGLELVHGHQGAQHLQQRGVALLHPREACVHNEPGEVDIGDAQVVRRLVHRIPDVDILQGAVPTPPPQRVPVRRRLACGGNQRADERRAEDLRGEAAREDLQSSCREGEGPHHALVERLQRRPWLSRQIAPLTTEAVAACTPPGPSHAQEGWIRIMKRYMKGWWLVCKSRISPGARAALRQTSRSLC
mmetsp:Transcript_9256/g.21505  ORF Transcript_9256/g.21505 Transcript_9256/m.21505 type:complete len:310 (+) Transcript_9256:242-1171(+)